MRVSPHTAQAIIHPSPGDGTTDVLTDPVKGTHYTLTNIVDGEAVDIEFTAVYTSKNVFEENPIELTDIKLKGDDSVIGNYNLVTTSLTVSGSITPASLTATVGDVEKEYGAVDPLITLTFGTAVGTEVPAYTAVSPARVAFGEDVGTYGITVPEGYTLDDDPESGFLASNYTVTYTSGTLTVEKWTAVLEDLSIEGDWATSIGVCEIVRPAGVTVSVTYTASGADSGYYTYSAVAGEGLFTASIDAATALNVILPDESDAVFSIHNVYTVVFVSGEGEFTSSQTITGHDDGSHVITAPSPDGGVTPQGRQFVSWTSSDGTVLSPGGVYNVTGRSITFSAVYEDIQVTGVTLDRSTLSLRSGASGTLVATVTPSDAMDTSVTWSTSDASVATVSDGTVTVVSAGMAVIAVTTNDGGYTATCTVTVTATPTSSPTPTPSPSAGM